MTATNIPISETYARLKADQAQAASEALVKNSPFLTALRKKAKTK